MSALFMFLIIFNIHYIHVWFEMFIVLMTITASKYNPLDGVSVSTIIDPGGLLGLNEVFIIEPT